MTIFQILGDFKELEAALAEPALSNESDSEIENEFEELMQSELSDIKEPSFKLKEATLDSKKPTDLPNLSHLKLPG